MEKISVSQVVISGTGLFTPEHTITNAELVTSYNSFAAKYNADHQAEIECGELDALIESSVEFIEKASGIKQRYVMDKAGVLDPDIMAPRLPERGNEETSVLASMALDAARQAMDRSGVGPGDIDAVLCACSNMQRAYPAMAVEIQNELGIEGFGFDMNVACSSATFGLQTASDMVRSGSARRVLMVNPEICSGHLNWRDRDSHFIFGDVATAAIVEAADDAQGENCFEIVSTRLKTVFSNNIRNNFGFLNRTHPDSRDDLDKLFVQEGRKVFKEVTPMVAKMILEHLGDEGIAATDLRRMWLHQANINMNRYIAHKVLGREASADEAPVVLDEYANTSSAGSIIAFHKHHDDLVAGDIGMICSFGAGYSAGTVIVRRL